MIERAAPAKRYLPEIRAKNATCPNRIGTSCRPYCAWVGRKGNDLERVTVLRVADRARLDAAAIQALVAEKGAMTTEEILCRASEALARRLSQVETEWATGDLAALRKTARRVSAVAGQIGMAGLVRVAGDVARCIDDGDAVALAATTARLLRVGDLSLSAVWNTRDGTL